MCVNPKVKKATSTASEINHDCSKMGKERKCRFKNKVEGFQAPSVESGAFGTQPVMDMEDLVTMGKTHKVCPFYYTRSLVEEAELVLVPYNYLFDKEARASTLAGVPWDNAVVIFDEAHNLESFASESASFDLTSTDIAGCVGEVQRALGYIQAMPELGERVKQDNLIRIKSIFLNLEEYILRLGNQSAYLGEFMTEIFEKGASITHANHELFINEVRKLTDIFMDVQGGTNARGAPRLEHFVQCIKRVFGESTEARCLAKAKSYRVHVTPKETGNSTNDSSGRTVSYWCFAPAEAMRELANLNIRSILVTSGTLSPLDSYAMELDLPFPHRIENPHIIPDDQIHVRVVTKGVSGKQLCSSYERRQDSEYFVELGNTLVSFGRVVPGGMLVFFPSYGVMNSCLERWGGPASSRPSVGKGKPSSFFAAKTRKNTTGTSRFSFPYTHSGTFSATKEATTPWTRLLATKAVVVEPRATSDLPDAIAEFHKYLNLPKSTGCILFGVCRGKISEGIDFANDMCRAVIITGLPFAPSFDAKVKMKREFLDGNRASQNVKATGDGGFGDKPTSTVSLSGHEWYTQQAHRAVNQAIGRVVRNKNDYGAVLLLDSRFGQARNQDGLSKWVRPHIQNDEGMGRAIGSLVKFYRNAEQKARDREKEQPQPVAPNEVSIILRYSDDDHERGQENVVQTSLKGGNITKVAIIRNSESTSSGNDETAAEQTADSASSSYIPPERIVARLETKRFEHDESKSKYGGLLKGNDDSAHESIEDLYARKMKAPQANRGEKFLAKSKIDQNLSRPAGMHPNGMTQMAKSSSSQQIAVQFFQLVQSRMSSNEQSSIKKAIVAMKHHGQQEDRKSYLLSAREIVRIIITHESFEERETDDKPEMLGLLFTLLPSKYRIEVQKMTMTDVLGHSLLGKQLKSHLSLPDQKTCRSSISMLLWEVWYKDDVQGKLSGTSYLHRCQAILSLFRIKAEHNMAFQLMASYAALMPRDLYTSTIALIEDLKASHKIQRMKEIEKSQYEPESVKCNTLLASATRACVKREGSSLNLKPDASSLSESPRSHNDEVTRDGHNSISTAIISQGGLEPVKKRSNPFPWGKRPAANDSETHVDSIRPEKISRAVPMKSLLSSVPKSCSAGMLPASNPVSMVVRQSESDTYLGKAIDKEEEDIESNVPTNLTCPICDQCSTKVCRFNHCLPIRFMLRRLTFILLHLCNLQPFLGECGHMACLDCWLQWLQKSESCPVCRAPTTKASLARVVFQKGTGPTPSQS